MVKSIHKPALITSVLIGLYLKFLLLPTANAVFELYHWTHVDIVYHLYSAFKVLAVVFNGWAYQSLTSVCIASLVFLLWQRRATKKKLRSANEQT